MVERGYSDHKAVPSALPAVPFELPEGHLGHRVTHATDGGGPTAQAKVREPAAAVERLVTS